MRGQIKAYLLPAHYDRERFVKTSIFGRACNFISVKAKTTQLNVTFNLRNNSEHSASFVCH